ncbi:hypothetical protein QJ515_13945, partial [Acinetobacter baumannii]|nr:hypothetical protein [Acinetobacter baumannii]
PRSTLDNLRRQRQMCIRDSYHALSNGRDFIAYNLLYGLNKQVIKANEAFILNDMNDKKNIDIFGQAAHDGSRISKGEYKDIVPITIEF